MANYGVTDAGFVIKRLNDLLRDKRQRAVQLFQDLVSSGDVVDTSESSLLGRLIALDVVGDADLWELGQDCWNSFDPNSATGISLDNLVQYSGISRFNAAPSTATGLFVGNNGVLIPSGSAVSDVNTNNQFFVQGSVALSPSQASGINVTVVNVLNNTQYAITYTTSNGLANTATYTSSASATASEILNGLKAVIDLNHPLLTATIPFGDELAIWRADVFQVSNFSVSAGLLINKVGKLGQLTCSVNGAVEQEANTLNTILTPVLGWDFVTNPVAASPGRLAETDEELRIRFRNTKLERSSNILDSLYSALLNVPNVEEVAIYENDTDVTDTNGVSPHSFFPVVLGGSSQVIAETIWRNKPMGISSEGNTVVTVTDSQGFTHDIGFERPNPVTVYIDITLSLDTESLTPFPGDGADQIRSEIISYAKDNFGVGRDIIYSRLFTPMNKIAGHQVDSLFIGTSPAPSGTSNIAVAFNEIGSFESVNINVTVV